MELSIISNIYQALYVMYSYAEPLHTFSHSMLTRILWEIYLFWMRNRTLKWSHNLLKMTVSWVVCQNLNLSHLNPNSGLLTMRTRKEDENSLSFSFLYHPPLTWHTMKLHDNENSEKSHQNDRPEIQSNRGEGKTKEIVEWKASYPNLLSMLVGSLDLPMPHPLQ